MPASPSEQDVFRALTGIPDPELGINIVDLGLVYGVAIDDGRVRITYTLTTLGCGIGPLLEAQMHEVVSALPGVVEVLPDMVLEPRWTRDRMSAEARATVGEQEFRPPSRNALWDRLLPREASGE